MKRWSPILLGVVFALAVWFALGAERRAAVTAAVGLSSPSSLRARDKPICTSVIVPRADASRGNGPRTARPGRRGKQPGRVITNKEGRARRRTAVSMRHGDSERARQVLYLVAKSSNRRALRGI